MLPKPDRRPGLEAGQYRKPSMFFSAYANTGVPVEAAKFISYFINDPAATEVLGVERGVPESAAVREALLNTLDELGRAQIEFIEGLGRPRRAAAAAAAGRRRRDRLRAQADQRGGRLRQPARGRRRDAGLRGHRDPGPGLSRWPRRTLQLRPLRAGAAGAARSGWLARAWAANGAGYLFLLPWLIGFFVLTLGPIADLALSLLHQLRPADAAALGRARELPAHLHRRREVLARRCGSRCSS